MPANNPKSYSLRARLLLMAAAVVVLFMLGLFPALQQVFTVSLERAVQERLAADASALIAAAKVEDGKLQMPVRLPVEEYGVSYSRQLGFIYDHTGTLVWRSSAAANYAIDYQPRYDGRGDEFLRTTDGWGKEFFVYDIEIDLLRGQAAAYSVVTMQPVDDYRIMYKSFKRQLYTWLIAALICLLLLLWLGLSWALRSLGEVKLELEQVETGRLNSLSNEHPRELLRLTNSLNRLLDSERQQRQKYRNSLDDLAHSLKTPLAVLQGVAEILDKQEDNRDLARSLRNQVHRMNQQVDYQLQRASLRRSGLLRHNVRLGPVLLPLLDALHKVYHVKEVKVQLDFDEELRVPVEQGALLELLGNLLENSFRLCVANIRIKAQISLNACEIRVEDDGPGVPVGQRERILQRGERLDTQNPGQGIGTAVVKDIIDSYQGTLFIEDSELGGAMFRLRLPLI